ncbi:tRNA dimethylallyltransferase [bacterium 336/3]|nr:tRNA dimethylallyltransferase [bacterium 336/3]
MKAKKKYLISVVGATAVGKTDLTITLAKELDTKIISADSRQFFKELSIGTAKPSKLEMKGVKHYLINNLSIKENYNIGDFEKDALHALKNIYRKNNKAILVGGSGLYCKALWEGIDDMPDIDLELRKQIQEEYQEKGLNFLQEEVKRLDPVYFLEVDIKNPQRLMRALEMCITTGQPFSNFRKGKKGKRNFHNIKIGLERPREELYERINQRMDLMLEAGLLEEAKAVYNFKHHNALQTVGYREIFDFMENKQDWNETLRLLKQNSRHYAKRQMTWFKKDTEIKWFHPSEYSEILEYIHEKISTF